LSERESYQLRVLTQHAILLSLHAAAQADARPEHHSHAAYDRIVSASNAKLQHQTTVAITCHDGSAFRSKLKNTAISAVITIPVALLAVQFFVVNANCAPCSKRGNLCCRLNGDISQGVEKATIMTVASHCNGS